MEAFFMKKIIKSGEFIMTKDYKIETQAIHAAQTIDETGSRAVPLHQTTAYVFEDVAQGANRFALTEGGNIYMRITNPTQSVFECRVAALEGSSADLAVDSDMAAISYAIQVLAKAGDNIVTTDNIYGGRHNLFEHTYKDFGID